VQQSTALQFSFRAAAIALLAWCAFLLLGPARSTIAPAVLLAKPRAQHYVQATVQLSVFAYWGWYWRPVYDFATLLIAQLLFAYAFGMLLAWSRRQNYSLGFGPFPILFSINLFLWFRDDFFHLQFLLIAIAFAGKEFIRWTRDGRSVHIFNPSAFPLALASLALIVTGTTDITRGPEIASTLGMGPHIYLLLFACGLVVMFLFNITLLTASAAVTLFALSALYNAITGVPYFLDSEIPSAVFLGTILLVTDPSTSPRSPLGKATFGTLYGVAVFALYSILGTLGAPTFYDKLLCVPFLNLAVRRVETFVDLVAIGEKWKKWRAMTIPRSMNLRHMSVWIIFFGAMTLNGRTDGRHPGDLLPFWQEACAEDRMDACSRLLMLETTYCSDNSGWACNELGVEHREGQLTERKEDVALAFLARACELRYQAACLNLLDSTSVIRTVPRVLDLRLLLREGGRNLMEMPERDLYRRACEHRWMHACQRAAAAL
jgi:hypothetical protein